MEILIVGDSFAAKHNGSFKGWADLLEEHFSVTNLAQCGVSEYKILKQLQDINLKKYNLIIISHTSPYRVHTRKYPVQLSSKLYKDCDLIQADIFYHSSKLINFFNSGLQTAKKWFLHHYDPEFQETIFDLFKKEILSKLHNYNVIDTADLDLPKLFTTNRGNVQHLDKQGNLIFFYRIKDYINNAN